MKQTMEWIFRKQDSERITYRCSVCNSEISVKHGEELPYCKHCESEPDGEQIANKMSDNDIIKALNECLTEPCGIQSFIYAVRNALDLITRQKEQIEGLIAGQETLQKYIAEKDKEIEKYKETIGELDIKDGEVVALLNGKETAYTKKDIAETLKRMAVKTAKAEAVKEFAERLEDCFKGDNVCDFLFVRNAINNLVKEMVGETDV
jgi:hypothetical protein